MKNKVVKSQIVPFVSKESFEVVKEFISIVSNYKMEEIIYKCEEVNYEVNEKVIKFYDNNNNMILELNSKISY